MGVAVVVLQLAGGFEVVLVLDLLVETALLVGVHTQGEASLVVVA